MEYTYDIIVVYEAPPERIGRLDDQIINYLALRSPQGADYDPVDERRKLRWEVPQSREQANRFAERFEGDHIPEIVDVGIWVRKLRPARGVYYRIQYDDPNSGPPIPF